MGSARDDFEQGRWGNARSSMFFSRRRLLAALRWRRCRFSRERRSPRTGQIIGVAAGGSEPKAWTEFTPQSEQVRPAGRRMADEDDAPRRRLRRRYRPADRHRLHLHGRPGADGPGQHAGRRAREPRGAANRLVHRAGDRDHAQRRHHVADGNAASEQNRPPRPQLLCRDCFWPK